MMMNPTLFHLGVLRNWAPGLGTGDAHVLVTVNALDPAPLADAMRQLEVLTASHGQVECPE